MQTRTRRGLLLGGTAMLGLLAGCSGGGGDDGNDEDEDDPEDNGDEGAGDQGDEDRQATPTASFAFDYEETGDAEGTLEIIHDGGDVIRASSLYLRGDGYTEVANAEMTENGQWAGATSGQKEGDPAVAAGDSVTLGVTSDYEMRVVWQPDTGATSATLGQDSGPDA